MNLPKLLYKHNKMKLSGAFLFHPEWAGVRPEFGPERPEWAESGPVIFRGAFCN